MRYAFAAAVAIVLVTAAACGGGLDAEFEILLEADTSTLASEEIDEVLERTEEGIERRFDAAGIPAEVRRQDSNRLLVRVVGIEPNEIRKLFEGGQLEFRVPLLDPNRNITCEDAEGLTISISPAPLGIPIVVDRQSNAAQCVTTTGFPLGSVVWERPMGINAQGEERELSGDLVRAVSVQEDPVGPQLWIEFSEEGGVLLAQVTTLLIGYPLGIFLDDELMAAPTMQQAIADGVAIFTMLDSTVVRRLAFVSAKGPLPVSVEIIELNDLRQ